MSSNMSLTVSPFLSVQNSDRTTAPENITSSTEPQGPNPNSTRTSTLLHISFNQDKSCFAIGTDNGFRIYSCDPFREILRPDVALGGIGQVQLLFRSTILALVGGGSEPHYSPYKVMIWDNHRLGCICELSFRSIVKGVRLRRDRIVVVLVQKVSVYNFVDLKLLDQIETIENPKGLCEISQSSNVNYVLVCPGIQKGQVRVEHYGPKRTKFIMAHDSSLACFALTPDGRVLATASGKGTLVRVFNALDGSLLQEVRRGSGRAEIYSLAFSSTAQWLAVSSDKGTVHIFSLKDETVSLENEKLPSNSGPYASNVSALSSFSVIKGVLPRYFSSEWSMAQIHLQEGLEYHVAFGHKKNTIIILGVDGSFYRCEFDPVKGGEMTKLESHNFLDPEENTM